MGTLQKEVVGQFALNDWYEQRNNEATIKGVVEQIQPVQEMLEFQRRFRTRQRAVTLAQGEFATFLGTVPRDECWRLHWVGMTHDDNADMFVVLRINPGQSGPTVRDSITIMRGSAVTAQDTPLYPSTSIVPSGTRFRQTGGPHPILLPGDAFQVVTFAALQVGPTVVNLWWRYELIPPPVLSELDNVIEGAAN